jgi:hypothetical protein
MGASATKNKSFDNLTFRIYSNDKQRLLNLKGLLENHYVVDLDIKKADLDIWSDLKLVSKNNIHQEEELKKEIEELEAEIKSKDIRIKSLEQNIEYQKSLSDSIDLKQKLKNHRIKQDLIADVADCSVSSVSNYLNGVKLGNETTLKIRLAIKTLLKEYKKMGS